jgi:hypothetical protein
MSLARGGSNEAADIQLLCRTCNLAKSDRLVLRFAAITPAIGGALSKGSTVNVSLTVASGMAFAGRLTFSLQDQSGMPLLGSKPSADIAAQGQASFKGARFSRRCRPASPRPASDPRPCGLVGGQSFDDHVAIPDLVATEI